MSFRHTFQTAAGTANDGWAFLNETLEGLEPQAQDPTGQRSPL